MFHRDLLSARFYVKRAQKNGLSRELGSFVQTKIPYSFPLPRLPYVLGLEPTTRCNLRCIMCPSPALKAPRGFMAMDLYQKILRQAKDGGAHRFRFVGLGEPLLHPELPAMVHLAKRAGIYTEITTNATLLTRELSLALLEAGLDEIGFSLDTTDPAAFERVRVGGSYHEVVANVEGFLALSASGKYESPITVARMVVMDGSDVEAFKRRWADKVDTLSFNVMRVYAGTALARKKTAPQGGPTPPPARSQTRCRIIMGYMPICWDGRVSLCNQSSVIIGDANTTPLEALWKGHILEKVRRLHAQYQGHLVDVCRSCPVINPRAVGGDEHQEEAQVITRPHWRDDLPTPGEANAPPRATDDVA